MITTLLDAPLFLFYLVNAKGQSYYIDPAGNLKLSGVPFPLDYSPDGWADLSIGWERNFDKFGLIRAFGLSLGFVGDGFRILEKIYNDKTIDEKVWLFVQKREVDLTPYVDQANPGEFDFVHRYYYKGEIDFSTYRKSRRRVTVNIMEGGRSKDLAANENTTYGIPLSNPETIRVKFDGIKFANRGNYATADGLEISNKNYEVFTVPVTILAVEGTPTGVAFTEQFIEPIQNISNYLSTSNNFAIKNDSAAGPVTITFSGKIRVKCTKNTINGNFAFAVHKQNTINGIAGVAFNAPFTAGQTYEKPFSATVTLNVGEKLFFVGSFGFSPAGAVEVALEFLPDSRFSASYANTFRSSFVRFYKPMDLFKRFVEKLSGSAAFAVSTLLAASEICFTSGDGLRGLPGAEVKETFSNFRQFWKVVKMAGIGIEGENIVLEAFAHFFDETLFVDLGEVKDLEIETAVELFFSSLKLGYLDQNYDDLNGRFEPNATQEYSGPQKRVAKKLELVSPIRGDFYGAEFTRINYDGKTTTDSDSDNDTFAVLVDLSKPFTDADGVYYKPKIGTYTSITGIPDPGLGNIEEMTPHRIAAQWRPYFRGVLLGYENEVIKFESATKNKDLVTVGGPGGTFSESADLPVLNGAKPAFAPKLIKVLASSPVNLAKIMAANPRTSFKMKYLGIPLHGFLLKGAIKSKTNQEQSFTFLATASTNFKLLENE